MITSSSALLVLAPEVTSAWESACALRGIEREHLRNAIEDRARITREPPVWVRFRRPDISRFYVMLGEDDVAVVKRAQRAHATGLRFCATALVDGLAIQGLGGKPLADAVELEAAALREFRERVAGVPDDARTCLRARIVSEGRLSATLPSWATTTTWNGLVLTLGTDIALALRSLRTVLAETGPRWSTQHCFVRWEPTA